MTVGCTTPHHYGYAYSGHVRSYEHRYYDHVHGMWFVLDYRTGNRYRVIHGPRERLVIVHHHEYSHYDRVTGRYYIPGKNGHPHYLHHDRRDNVGRPPVQRHRPEPPRPPRVENPSRNTAPHVTRPESSGREHRGQMRTNSHPPSRPDRSSSGRDKR